MFDASDIKNVVVFGGTGAQGKSVVKRNLYAFGTDHC
jgi:hypothetical protein